MPTPQPLWPATQFTISTFCVIRPGDPFEEILPRLPELGLDCLELNTPLEYAARDLSPDEVHRVLALCERLGLRLIITDHERLTGVLHPTEAQLQWLVREYGSSPALGGWYAWDEPHPEHFAGLARTYALLAELDPTHPVLNAMLPAFGGHNWPDAYPAYARGFVDTVKPPLLSFDNYGVHRDGIRPGLFRDLGLWGSLASGRGLPLWFYPACCRWATIAPPTAATVRFQAWNALAHGAKGLQWFVVRDFVGGDVDFVEAPLRADGSPGALAPTFSAIMREARAAGTMLLDAKLAHAAITTPEAEGCPGAGSGPVGRADDELVVGVLDHPQGRLVVLVNRDLARGRKASAVVDGVEVSAELEPGGGALLDGAGKRLG